MFNTLFIIYFRVIDFKVNQKSGFFYLLIFTSTKHITMTKKETTFANQISNLYASILMGIYNRSILRLDTECLTEIHIAFVVFFCKEKNLQT